MEARFIRYIDDITQGTNLEWGKSFNDYTGNLIFGVTYLLTSISICRGYTDVLNHIVQQKIIPIQLFDSDDSSNLYMAVLFNNADAAKIILQHIQFYKVDEPPNEYACYIDPDDYNNILGFAVFSGDRNSMVKLLMEHGKDVDCIEFVKTKLLDIAVGCKNKEIEECIRKMYVCDEYVICSLDAKEISEYKHKFSTDVLCRELRVPDEYVDVIFPYVMFASNGAWEMNLVDIYYRVYSLQKQFKHEQHSMVLFVATMLKVAFRGYRSFISYLHDQTAEMKESPDDFRKVYFIE